MEWLEEYPIPDECKDCQEEECYNCDAAGKRWTLSNEDALRTRRALMIRAMKRLERQIAAIDKELHTCCSE